MKTKDFLLMMGITLTSTTCSVVLAALMVVADHGGVSTKPYLDKLAPSLDTDARPKGFTPMTESSMLPVESSQLSPGLVDSRPVNYPMLPNPLFVVGADEVSLAWLEDHGEALHRIGAIGFAVNVPDLRSLSAIRRTGNGLKISPVGGNDFVKAFGINHYPVLITKTTLEQ